MCTNVALKINARISANLYIFTNSSFISLLLSCCWCCLCAYFISDLWVEHVWMCFRSLLSKEWNKDVKFTGLRKEKRRSRTRGAEKDSIRYIRSFFNCKLCKDIPWSPVIAIYICKCPYSLPYITINMKIAKNTRDSELPIIRPTLHISLFIPGFSFL